MKADTYIRNNWDGVLTNYDLPYPFPHCQIGLC